MNLIGIILAAGRSRRMGALKQTLPWPRQAGGPADSTIVASAFDAIAPHCRRMLVVEGRAADAVIAALGQRRFTRVAGDSEAPMFESIRAAMRAIIDDAAPQTVDGALLQPADHPGVAGSTIEILLLAFAADPAKAVFPEHGGKGGHPAVIPPRLFGPIVEFSGEGGLRQFWIDHVADRVRLAVDDSSCVLDLDTPMAYQAALRDRIQHMDRAIESSN